MRILIDTANVEQIKEMYDAGVICGATTNPTLIAKEGKVSLNTELAAVNAATASMYKEIIEDTLDEYVIKEYQSAVWENIVENVPLDYVSLKANASKRTIQRWKQKFIWGIAENLGINFGNLGRFVETIKVSEEEIEKMFSEKRGEKDE